MEDPQLIAAWQAEADRLRLIAAQRREAAAQADAHAARLEARATEAAQERQLVIGDR